MSLIILSYISLLKRGVQQIYQQIARAMSVGMVSVSPLVKCGTLPRPFSAAKNLNIQINT